MRDQHGEADQRKHQAGAARDLAADLERADGAGEQEEYECPGKKDGANLIAHGEKFGRPVLPINLQQANEQRRHDHRRANGLPEIGGSPVAIDVVQQGRKDAGEKDRRKITADRKCLDGLVTDRPFSLPFRWDEGARIELACGGC